MVKLTDQIVYIRTKCTPETVKKLNLWGCDIDDIELCERMTQVEILSLSVNGITTLEPLRNCRKLKELYLRKNNIESLEELDYIKDLPDLHTLWIDENPCTMANDYRYKIVKKLPKLTKLDDKPITLHDHEKPPETPVEVEIGRDQDYYASTNTLVNNCYGRGGAIVDTIMQPGFVQYGGATSSEGSEEESSSHPPPSHRYSNSSMAQSMHPAMVQSVMGGPSMMSQSMTQSMMQLMNQSMYQQREEQNETDDWGDFNLEDEVTSSSRPLSMDGIAPRMAASYYDSGSRTMRPSTSAQFVPGRSVSVPRRRYRPRGESTSPAREGRVQRIMSAVSVLLDELDTQGLRQVVEEAQRRMKKQR